MRIKKWIMKQQWRIVQIRGIWSLISGILVLASAYFGYFPFFSDMGIYGPFLFAAVVMIGFLVLGYIYDRKLMMWAPSQEVTVERNPYQYVPSPKEHIYWFPVYSTLLDIAEELANEYHISSDYIRETKEYYAELEKLRPERNEDIERGIELRKEFIEKHSFKEIVDDQT